LLFLYNANEMRTEHKQNANETNNTEVSMHKRTMKIALHYEQIFTLQMEFDSISLVL